VTQPVRPARIARFGAFQLDLEAGELRKSNVRMRLQYQPLQILTLLLESAGGLVTREEIRERLWSNDATVEFDLGVGTAMKKLRQALSDDATNPRFVETLPRRGYRWLMPVVWEEKNRSNPEDTAFPAVRSGVSQGNSGPSLSVKSPNRRLVGRDRVIGELRDSLRSALSGERQIFFVAGEPGIGKTALADEFQKATATQNPSLRIARGQCVEGYGGKEAYFPMLEALGQLCHGNGGEAVVQILASQAPTWLVQFAGLIKRERRESLQEEIAGATRERMVREINEALEAITATTPLLLIFEDLQWVDPSTVDLISEIARRRMPAKLMLVGTYRLMDLDVPELPLKALTQELLARQLCKETSLKRLCEAEVAEYLAAESPRASLPEGLAGLMHRHSEGNPLFMVAALDHLTEKGLIVRENDSWQLKVALERIALEVPESLRRMIEAQIDRLEVEERRGLEVASVSGIAFLVSVSAAAANVDGATFEALCDRLGCRHHMVRWAGSQRLPDGTVTQRYEFVHALYREVFYRRQLAGRRAKLHGGIAEQLEKTHSERLSEVAPELAYHFEEASDWARGVKYLLLAADTAGRRYASREATALLQRALEMAGKLPAAPRAEKEIEILERLATVYVVSFDPRAVATYETLAARAAQYGFVDVEARALIDMAYPVSWASSERCLEIVDRALQLSTKQDASLRARTRASCFVRRVWATGWNSREAQECREAMAEIRLESDPKVLASHLVDYSFMQWISSDYRAARSGTAEGLAILSEQCEENPYLSFAHWEIQIILPWILLFLGDWGAALQEIKAGIKMVDKNEDYRRAQTLRVYRAWVHLHAMDFHGVRAICESVLPLMVDPAWRPWRRFCLVLAGSAEAGLGNHARALEYLLTTRDDMGRHKVIHDWYCRLLLESALAQIWLAEGDLNKARTQANQFLELTLATAEHTWQALGWTACAKVAIAERDSERASVCVANAFGSADGFEVPLAEWQMEATAAEHYEGMAKRELAEGHRKRSRASILKLANSLAADQPLRQTFLSSPAIANILGVS
jgi:DNA-binding winged helix-turn-helix (wHTH) protein